MKNLLREATDAESKVKTRWVLLLRESLDRQEES
jgi:hypothetical protein